MYKLLGRHYKIKGIVVEGNKEQYNFNDLDIVEHVKLYIDDGLVEKEAIKRGAAGHPAGGNPPESGHSEDQSPMPGCHSGRLFIVFATIFRYLSVVSGKERVYLLQPFPLSSPGSISNSAHATSLYEEPSDDVRTLIAVGPNT